MNEKFRKKLTEALKSLRDGIPVEKSEKTKTEVRQTKDSYIKKLRRSGIWPSKDKRRYIG